MFKSLLVKMRKQGLPATAQLLAAAKACDVDDLLQSALDQSTSSVVADASIDVVAAALEKADKKKKPSKPVDDEDTEDSEDGNPDNEDANGEKDDESDDNEEAGLTKKPKKKPKSKKKPAAKDEGDSVDEEDCDKDDDDDEEMSAKKALVAKSKSFSEVLKASSFPHLYQESTDCFILRFDSARLLGLSASDTALRKAAGYELNDGTGDFHPTDAEFQKILSLSPKKKYAKTDFKVYKTVSAGTGVDRHFEHFLPKALTSMARSAIGSPLLKDHDYSKSDGVIGRIFDGMVSDNGDGSKYLVQKIAVHNIPENKPVIDGIESGMNGNLSVGVRVNRKDYLCDICNKAMYQDPANCTDWSQIWCGHVPGQDLKDGSQVTASIADATQHELSRVTVPAQPWAGVKSLNAGRTNLSPTEQAMTNALKSLGASMEQVAKQQKAAAPQTEGEENMMDKELVKSIGETNALMKQMIGLLKTNDDAQKAQAAAFEKRLAQQEAAFEKRLGETRELLSTQVKNLDCFIAHCVQITGKSISEISADLRGRINKGSTVSDEEKNLRDKEGTDFYLGVMDRFK